MIIQDVHNAQWSSSLFCAIGTLANINTPHTFRKGQLQLKMVPLNITAVRNRNGQMQPLIHFLWPLTAVLCKCVLATSTWSGCRLHHLHVHNHTIIILLCTVHEVELLIVESDVSFKKQLALRLNPSLSQAYNQSTVPFNFSIDSNY